MDTDRVYLMVHQVRLCRSRCCCRRCPLLPPPLLPRILTAPTCAQIRRIGSPGFVAVTHPAQQLPFLQRGTEGGETQTVAYDRVLCDVPCRSVTLRQRLCSVHARFVFAAPRLLHATARAHLHWHARFALAAQ